MFMEIYSRDSRTEYPVMQVKLDNLRSLIGTKIAGFDVDDFRYRPSTDEVILHLMQDSIPASWKGRVNPKVVYNRKRLVHEIEKQLSA